MSAILGDHESLLHLHLTNAAERLDNAVTELENSTDGRNRQKLEEIHGEYHVVGKWFVNLFVERNKILSVTVVAHPIFSLSQSVTIKTTLNVLSKSYEKSFTTPAITRAIEPNGCKQHSFLFHNVLLKIGELVDPAREFLLDDAGAITFYARVMICINDNVGYPTSLRLSSYEYPTLDIDLLYSDGPDSDIDVIAKDGKTFGCHTFVLEKNPVFQNVYLKYEQVNSDDECAGPPAKKKKLERRSIVLPDMKSDVLKVMLLHIYDDSPKIDVSIAGDVFHAAETHDLPLLKRECETAMSENISEENLIDYFQLSEMANATLLKKECLKFLKKNMATIVVLNEWKDFIKSAGSDIKKENLINYIIVTLAASSSD